VPKFTIEFCATVSLVAQAINAKYSCIKCYNKPLPALKPVLPFLAVSTVWLPTVLLELRGLNFSLQTLTFQAFSFSFSFSSSPNLMGEL